MENQTPNQIPTFDTLPILVLGLKQEFAELKAMIKEMQDKQPVLPDEQRLYGNQELANYLSCTVPTAIRIRRNISLPFHKAGRKYYYLRSEVDKALTGRTK